MPPASLSGSLVSAARISIVALPMVSRAPGLMPSRASSAGSAAAPKAPSRCASASASASGRIEHGLSEQRIGAVDRLHLDQRGLAVGGARHGAHGGGARDFAVAVEERPLVRRGLALDQRERQVAAEDDLALARQAVGEARRQRADAGDRHAAERDAGDEHVEAAQAAAHLAQREAQAAASGRFRAAIAMAATLMARSRRRCGPSAAARSARSARRAPYRA